MKGIALSTEVIVFLILGILVLIALLFLFGLVVPPGQEHASGSFEKTKWCGQYVSIWPRCDQDVPNDDDYGYLYENLTLACGGADVDTLKVCCSNFCVL